MSHAKAERDVFIGVNVGYCHSRGPFVTSIRARLVVASFAQRIAEPLQTFVKTIT